MTTTATKKVSTNGYKRVHLLGDFNLSEIMSSEPMELFNLLYSFLQFFRPPLILLEHHPGTLPFQKAIGFLQGSLKNHLHLAT